MSPPSLARRLLRPRSVPPAEQAVDDGLCEELRAAPPEGSLPAPTSPGGCEDCLALGTTWVHLRLCLTCGHVGCCDTGQWKHARRHAEESGHAVMRSFEPGEAWRWCFVHERLG